MSEPELDALLHETRRFEPPADLARDANATAETYADAAEDRLAWWEEQAKTLDWAAPWDQVLEWQLPFSKWFIGGKLNACVNAVDRHVDSGAGAKVAFHWVGDGERERRDVTYADLKREVCKAANALTALGVNAGDRVTIYMPMIPETVVTMLACARIGAPHNVVFCGFSSDSLRGRILDSDSHAVVTTDGQFRRGAPTPVKPAVDEALEGCPDVHTVLVVRRTGDEVSWTDDRDVWWHDVVESASEEHEAEAFDSEHPLFMMYTSGTTAKPKGILHTTGGYLTHVSTTHRLVFDLKPDSDVYWCAADIGWITGHSYIVYGPLINQATSVMYEGTPHPGDKARWWKLIQDHKVSILYTAPTTIRTLMKWGAEELEPYDLTSLRLLGSVGEPINPEAWIWYREHVGGGRTPVVDTWWQTETGGIMITPLPGVTATKPGAAMTAFPGVSADVVDNDGKPVGNGGGGFLVLTEPWPGMLRGIWGDDERYKETYWSRFDGFYFAGDGAKKDDDGDLWLLGRVDDVMNVSGHRISTTEVEHALVSHPSVAEAAVVGASDATTGQAIVAFVTPRGSVAEDESSGDEFVQSLREHVAKQIGPIAKPRQVLVTPELPKTRSGKIMRRLLRDIAEHRELGDVTTLLDPTVTDAIREHMSGGPEKEE
ncbi:MAG TPA: acetate--CoA ligase [Mycobacteriales bacterium]|nr:acetate--CoA ligase [Mycobacteriales bacterium]